MTLVSGTTLAHYTILGPLGAGAMGEVYRARDSKLGREVAIKVLPEHFADDEERLRRFEREAKTLASLNHPNVAQIFGVDQVGDTCFLVLELVPGESLDERLKRGPLPIDEALDVCKQIAEGLEAAHEAGVIHRDLKPANVRVTPEGKVKVLDFGLAKPAGGASDSKTSTDSVLSTEAGRLLGTPTYMAPEQARGKSIDKRVDIWAFGCVLYECLTAKRAFAGETMTDVLGSVLHAQPDLAALPAHTPIRVRTLLARCFEKDPRQRLRDAGDARLILARDPQEAEESAPASVAPRARGWMVVAWVASLAAAAGVTFLATRPAPPAPAPIVRTSVRLPKELSLAADDGCLALSPDGRMLALSGSTSGEERRLYVRLLDSLTPQALSGTEDASYPFWSPDGRTIAFFAKGKLKRIPAAGGSVTTICDATTEPRGGAWGAGDTIVFSPAPVGPLVRVPASGGTPVVMTQAVGEASHRNPHFLPDGKRVVYAVMSAETADGIYLLDLATGTSTRISNEHSEGIYADGWLLFVRAGNLMAQPFDATLAKLGGEAKLVAENVSFDVFRDTGTYSVSAQGTLVYSVNVNERRLEWFDIEGRSLGAFGTPARFETLSVSPTGDRVLAVVGREGGLRDLWLYDTQRGLGSKTVENVGSMPQCWSPDGQSMTYSVSENADLMAHVRSVSGAGQDRRLGSGYASDWSRDGTWISLTDPVHGAGFEDVMLVRADGSEPSRPIVATPAQEAVGLFSPDGHWLLFASDQSRRQELYAAPLPGPGPVRPITSGGVSYPVRWLDDGRVVYVQKSGELWSIPVVSRADTLEIGAPVQLFGGRKLPSGPMSITSDGKRILLAVPSDEEAERALNLVQNWPAALGGEKR